jgi:thioredoxin-related protein
MESNITKKIELAANVAIIVVAILISAVAAKNYFLTRTANQPPSNSQTGIVSAAPARNENRLQPGTKVNLSDVDWARNQKTLVLALSNTCHFCTDSADLYKRLAEQRIERGLRLVAVLPQSIGDGQAYLKKLGVTVDEVKQAPLASFGVTGTPTLMLVDSGGILKQSWTGKLPPDKEADLFKSL